MMLHPATAHFAMVLPVVATAFGLAYLYTRTEGMSKISSRLTLFAAIAMIGVWYTGNDAGSLIYSYLSSEGKEELLEHKQLGLYLAIAMGVIALLKLIGCKMKKFGVEILAISLLFVVMIVTFLQGKMGGEIVYNYGMPFKSYTIEKIVKTAYDNSEEAEEDEEKVELYEDAIDEINSFSQKVDKVYGNPEKSEKNKEDEE